MDGEEDESYTESGPDIVLSIIRSWKTCVAMNCPRNAAEDVEMSLLLLLYADVIKDEETDIGIVFSCCVGDILLQEFLRVSMTKALQIVGLIARASFLSKM